MQLPQDFEELLAAFEREGVRSLLVGGYAVSLHSKPRTTKDIDLWIDGGDNLERVARALRQFGAPDDVVEAARTLGPTQFLFMGRAPLRIDLLRSIAGVPDFAGAYARSEQRAWGARLVHVLCLDDLIASKRAAGRAVDRRDVRALEKARTRAPR